NWMKDKIGRFLTPEEGEKFFREVEKLPSTLSGMRKSLDEISNSHKGTEETMKEIYKLLCENSETLNGIYVAVTARDNEQRSHKKPYASHDKKTKAKEEGNIGELDEFDEIEALEFVKSALNIVNNLQNKEIKKLAQKLQYSRLALKLAVTYISEENIAFSCRGRKGIRVGDYLKKCEKIAEKLLDFKPEYKSDRYAKATFITWKITIDVIVQKKFGPEALGILVIMAYLDSNDICIEEIFSKAIAEDEKRVWSAVKLLDRYSIINLREGIVNIHKLVQKIIIRSTLQEKGREERILRTALKLINNSSITQRSIRHVASVWRYASQYGKLIDDFYFTCGEQKYTPLRLLDESGDYEAVRRILTHMEGKHLDRSSARYKRELDIVRYLVKKGANVNAKDKNGNTPLHFATMVGKVDIAKVLLKHNADVNAENNEGRTALYYAVKYNHQKLVELLLAYGAVPVSAESV
ncbi:MAG: ankyrin repeat domain-containing protein, partial [Wolbachia endosymbiont of Menacanthus eurysternus]|nr:ankyrin repeat domain-containing protein [Wolbachia endosymbiont of Menacanthus eurysternus]